MTAAPRQRKVPNPPGATVELPLVSAEDAELVRHRVLLDAVVALELLYRSTAVSAVGPAGVPPEVFCTSAGEKSAGPTSGTHVLRRLTGWELKCFSIMHSAFEEDLLLDADNCPVRNPAFLFDEPPYLQKGEIFWPDYTRLARSRAVWAASGIAYRDEPEFESGQMVVDKRRCWKALNAAMHLNELSAGAWG